MLLPASTYTGASAFAWPAALFLWGPGSWSDLHRHHCVQLVMALSGTLRFRQRQRQRWTTCGAVLVRPDAWHEVDARGTDVMIAFVDAESDLGAAFAARTESHVAPFLLGQSRSGVRIEADFPDGSSRRALGDSSPAPRASTSVD
jgi:hypothetical protein